MDPIRNPTRDYRSPSSNNKCGSVAETSSLQYQYIVKVLYVSLWIAVVLLGCMIAYYYFHKETTFQEKFNSLNDDVKNLRQQNSNLEALILLLASDVSSTKSILSAAIERSYQGISDTLNFRIQTIEDNFKELTFVFQADISMKIELTLNQTKILKEKTNGVNDMIYRVMTDVSRALQFMENFNTTMHYQMRKITEKLNTMHC